MQIGDKGYLIEVGMKGKIRFIRGRLKFGNSKNSASFPSAIVIFQAEAITTWNRRTQNIGKRECCVQGGGIRDKK